MRMICFEPSLRSKLETSRMDGSTVAVANSQVKPARGGGVEIMATSHSEVSASPRKMNVTVCGVEEVDVELRELNSLVTNTDVSVCIKVISVAAPDVVHNREGSELAKQDCVVGDSSGCSRVVPWERDVGALVEGMSYKLKSAGVRCYEGVLERRKAERSSDRGVEMTGSIELSPARTPVSPVEPDANPALHSASSLYQRSSSQLRRHDHLESYRDCWPTLLRLLTVASCPSLLLATA